jgi:hypothetical protein
MIIDSHLHIDLRGYTEQKLLDHLSKNKIERAWLLSWEEDNPQLKSYSHVSRERILEICDKYPDRFVPFYAPDPGKGDLNEKLRFLNSNGFRGVGELKVALLWKDEAVERLLKGITQKVLIFHMQDKRYYSTSLSVKQKIIRDYKNERFTGGMKKLLEKTIASGILRSDDVKLNYFSGYLSDFDGLEMRLSQFPHISFVAHAWLFWSHIEGEYSMYQNLKKGKIRSKGIIWDLLEKYPNLYCDISAGSGWNAMTRDKNIAGEFLEKYYRKILFGTDNTGLDFIQLIKSFRLPEYKEEAIFYRNSSELLQ